MTRPLPSPIQSYHTCPPLECNNRPCKAMADHECTDCFLQHCEQCINDQLNLSPPYKDFHTNNEGYICTACFIDILHNELHF